MSQTTPWWDKDAHRDRRPFLTARGAITRAVRRWFEDRGFTEVLTLTFPASPGNEAHLHAFSTEAIGPDGRRAVLHLHTSPEFAAKKLLAAGETKIFDLARVWRNRERGPLHHPEFTLLEWYRTDEPYETLMEDCARLLALAAQNLDAKVLTWRGAVADPFAEPERVSVAQAYARFAGIDLLATVGEGGATDRGALASAAQGAGIRIAADDTWADIFSRIMVEKVESNLGFGRPTILCEYPTAEAALAVPRPPTRGWPSGSSSMPAGWSWPTALASSPIRPNSAAASRPRWMRRPGSMGSAIPSTRTSWPRSPTCRPPVGRRWASIAWSCWRPAPSGSNR